MSTIGTYVIRKGAFFYRPGFRGYTANIEEAGRYTLAEAQGEQQNRPDEVSFDALIDCRELILLRVDEVQRALMGVSSLLRALAADLSARPEPVPPELNNSRDGGGI